MKMLGSRAAGKQENKNKFNEGSELQSSEFSDGSGLDLYDAGWRMYDQQIGRFHSSDPLASDYASYSNYNYAFNNPIVNNDPTGESANYVVDDKNKTITVSATIWAYGGAATTDNAKKIAGQIQDAWNAAGATMMLKDADGHDVSYAVSFSVTSIVATEDEISTIKRDGTLNAGDNFVRVEETGFTKWSQGGNDGFVSMTDVNNSPTTAAHEFGHGLGWKDISMVSSQNDGLHDFKGVEKNGMKVPSIMTARNTSWSSMGNPPNNCNMWQPDFTYFDSNGKVIPNKRQVQEENVRNVLRGVTATSPKNGHVGTMTNYKITADGKWTGRKF